jgi:cell division protein FtsW
MDLANKLFKGDRVIWIIFMFLCLISVLEVFSATSTIAYKNANYWAPIARHGFFLIGGFVLVLLLHNIPYRFFPLIILLLPVSIVMLLAAPFVGVELNDAHRWLDLFGIQFQPSEFAKLSIIVYIAFLLSKRNRFTDDQIFKYILIAVGITCVLILPENFSTAFMLFGVSYLLMFIGQMPIKKMLLLAGILILALGLFIGGLMTLQDNVLEKIPRASVWKGRLVEHLNHQKENTDESGVYKITDENYQVSHANMAIANGGVFGQMPGHGEQRDFLPQAYSDFIYAIIIEELGMVGGVFVLLLYIMLLVRVAMIARRCEKLFPKFLVLGCGLLVVIQAIFNMSVAVNLIPVTGQPMPLVSRGGTSTLISCVYFGIILSVSRFGANMGNESDLSEEPDSQQEIAAEVGGAEDASNEQTAITEVKTEEEPDENPLTAVKSLDEVKEKTDI